MLHHYVETGVADPPWASKADIKTLEKKIFLSGIEREAYWPAAEGRSEVTFAIELETATLIVFPGPRDGADWWKTLFDPLRYLTGTIDWLYHDGRISDLKTGAWPVDPEEHKQLLSYSLVPWIAAGMPFAWEREVDITQWGRYPLPALPVRKYWKVTGLRLMEHLEDLRWAVAHPTKVRVAPQREIPEGKLHTCAGCPSAETFPASDWMQSFFYRTLPSCARGLASIARNVLPED